MRLAHASGLLTLIFLLMPSIAWSNGAADCNIRLADKLVKEDPAQWFHACQELANTGNAEGQVLLGLSYEAGWGVTRDSTEAIKWYRKAADQGLCRCPKCSWNTYSSVEACQNPQEAVEGIAKQLTREVLKLNSILVQELSKKVGITQNYGLNGPGGMANPQSRDTDPGNKLLADCITLEPALDEISCRHGGPS